MTVQARLDDLYKMIAYTYYEPNQSRSKEATFLHFVEVCGALTMHDREKRRDSIDVVGAICKALGWYFPLLAKMNVKSVESLIFRKFPGVCPYCRKAPHVERECKLVRGADPLVDHDALGEIYDASWKGRPKTLTEWQEMFGKIYPRAVAGSGFSTIALFEELGELAEAIRVFDDYPHYFYGEAADVFSYLMGIANEYELRIASKGDETFDLETEFLKRYPGICVHCGSKACVCPRIPQATIGRMAKEIPLDPGVISFSNRSEFVGKGKEIADVNFAALATVDNLAINLPFDRGEINSALIQLCLKMASAVDDTDVDLAARLREEALRLGVERKPSGTRTSDDPPHELIDDIKAAWSLLDPSERSELRAAAGPVGGISHLLETRVLIVIANPPSAGGDSLRLTREVRAVQEAIERGELRDKIKLEILPASRPDDLRRKLLRQSYQVIHFSGHADADGLYFEAGDGSQHVGFSTVAAMLKHQPDLICVLFNACNSAQKIGSDIAPMVIGMMEEIPDDAAIAFSTGFYDALSMSTTVDRAVQEGKTAMESAGFEADYVRLLS